MIADKKNNAFGWSRLICMLTVLFFCGDISAQVINISGRVTDQNSGEPVAFANILIMHTEYGTATDPDGTFRLQTTAKQDTLLVTFIGYKTDTIVLSDQPDQYYKVQLASEDYALSEIVIKPKEDPAKVLMRKVIENKKTNDQQNIVAYKARGYTKIELDLGNITVAIDSSDKKRAFDVLLDHIDSTSDETTFLPFFFTETVSDFYYRRNPKTRKEIILASRTSGINNASATQVLGNYYEQFNIYDNYWFLLSKNFVTPVTDAWNFFYKVDLVDSALIDNDFCYRINFTPKQQQENVFNGYMWIADSSYAVKEVFMQLDSSVNINYYKRAVFYMNYEHYRDSVWVLKNDKLIVEFMPTKNSASVIGRKTTVYSDFDFDHSVFEEVAHYKDDIVYNDSVINNDELFWKDVRPDALTQNETGVYELVDSLKNIKSFMTLVDVYNTLMYGYWNLGYVRIGPFANMISSNDVEGFRVRLGGKTGDLISKRFSVGGYGAYGFDDHTFKYGSEFSIVLAKKPYQQFRFNYDNDLDVSNNESVTFGEDNLLSGFYRRRDTPQKINDRERVQWYYQKDWLWGLSNSVTLTNVQLDPLFDIYYFNQNDSLVSKINNSELKIGLRFAYREKFMFDNYRRYSLGTKYPKLEIYYRTGLKDFMGAGFTYNAFEVNIWDFFTWGSFGGTSYTVKAGKIFGTLPTLLLETPPGNETYFMNHNNFNLMNEYEFVNDAYAELFLTHSFYGFFLNKIPYVNKLKLREVATFKLAYGQLSDANVAMNDYMKNTAPYYIGNGSVRSDKPYMEAGIGVENIFKLIRVDAIWRLTYRNNPYAPNFGVRLGVNLDI